MTATKCFLLLLLTTLSSAAPVLHSVDDDIAAASFILNRFPTHHHLMNTCSAILEASHQNTIHFITDSEAHLQRQLFTLHRHYTVVTKTFSSLKPAAENAPKARTTCCLEKRPPSQSLHKVVLAVRPTESQLEDLFSHACSVSDTIFILVLDRMKRDFKIIIRQAWRQKYIFRVVILSLTNPQTVILYQPFVKCISGSFRRMHTSKYTRIAGHLIQTINSLNRCPLRISMYPREPTAVLLGNNTLIGPDGMLIDLLAQKMNFSAVTNLVRGRMIYGYRVVNGSYVGTFANLLDGTSDISLNGHFMKNYDCDCIQLTRHVTSDRVCLLTPKAGVVPPIITVLKSFQPQVWAMLGVTYVAVVLSYYFSSAPYSTDCRLALDIFRLFVASPLPRKVSPCWQKVLFAFCWFFSIVILNSFQGSLVTFLNTPIHFRDIDSFEDLIESGLPLRTSSYTFSEMLLSDSNLAQLGKRLHYSKMVDAVDNFQGRFAGFQRINIYNLKYFKDIKYMLNNSESRLLHTMSQCLVSYLISYAVPRHSPFKRRIDTILSRVEHAGLLIKWNADSAKYIFQKYQLVTKESGREYMKVFSLRDLEVAFFVLGLGSLCSTIIFMLELLVFKYRLARKKGECR